MALTLAFLTAVAAPASYAAAAGPGFVDATSIVPGLGLDMRYAGADNFMGRPAPGYEAPRCLLTPQAARALALVQADLQRSGWGLKVFDCYRPARAVAAFVRWARDREDQGRKQDFFPETDKASLIRLGYIAARSAHSSGSTVDLTMRSDAGDADMGTGFDYFGPRAWIGARGLTPEQISNRSVLRISMVRHGFVPYRREWWHFSLASDPHRGEAFDVPVNP